MEKQSPQQQKKTYIQAVGRRKEATARVRLYQMGKREMVIGGHTLRGGTIIVNNKPIVDYFPGAAHKVYYMAPFAVTNTAFQYAATIKVAGGGILGQRGAVIHGLARALDKIDSPAYRPLLKAKNLLSRDPRAKERRKAGFAGKARARKQSPKR